MFDSNSDQIKDEARRQLSGKDAKALTKLWDEIYIAFQKWKQEHGDRKPMAHRGMLSDLSGKSMPFKKAEPWQCADFQWPSPVALAMKLWREDYAPIKTITDREGIRSVLALLIAKYADNTSPSDLFAAHNVIVRHQSLMEGIISGRQLGLQTASQKQKRNLAKGPEAAAAKRKADAKKKKAALLKAIEGMFDKPEKPGWNMTSPEIVNFLLKSGNPYGYAESVILVTVKKEAAKYRKAGNVALAQ